MEEMSKSHGLGERTATAAAVRLYSSFHRSPAAAQQARISRKRTHHQDYGTVPALLGARAQSRWRADTPHAM